MVEKFREKCFREFSHDICADDNSLAKIDLHIQFDQKRNSNTTRDFFCNFTISWLPPYAEDAIQIFFCFFMFLKPSLKRWS